MMARYTIARDGLCCNDNDRGNTRYHEERWLSTVQSFANSVNNNDDTQDLHTLLLPLQLDAQQTTTGTLLFLLRQRRRLESDRLCNLARFVRQ